MSALETVRGTIDTADLGLTLVHEHVRFRDEAVAENWPGRYDAEAEFAGAMDAVTAAQAHRDEDIIAAHFIDDIERGVQGTPIRAAFLKCAADAAGVTANVEKVHRACARASLQTGAPIMAHSSPAANTGPRQVDIFLEEGVSPEKIQVAHCGDSPDVEYIQGLLDRGVYVGLDRYGLEMYLPIDQRNAVTAELLRRGHDQRVMISQDFCATVDWFPQEVFQRSEQSGMIRKWSMTLVFEEVVHWLREQGVMDDVVFETVFVANPARWLRR